MIATFLTVPQLIVFHAGVVLLVAAAIAGIASMGRAGAGLRRWVPALTAAGFCVFTAVGVWRWAATGALPVTDVASVTVACVWCLVAVYLVASAVWNLERLAPFLLGLAILLALMALGMRVAGEAEGAVPETVASSARAVLHLGPLLLGFALFGLAAVASAGYLIQHRALKSKGGGGPARGLPSLERLAAVAHVSIEIGLPLVVAGVVVGFAFQALYGRLPGRWYAEPSVVLSVVTVAVFAVLLWAVHSRRVRGTKAAWLVVVGFALVVLALVWGGHAPPAV